MDKNPAIALLLLLFVLAPATSLFGQRSLYQDYKAQRIGDVVTIRLQENISGATQTDNTNRSGRAGQASGSVSGNMTPFLPLFGAGASVDYQADDRNRAAQSQLLQGTISARIEDILPNGDLLVFGERSMEINGEHHKLSIRGFIRPNDVDVFNSVPSFRVANAEIVYLKEGGAAKAARKPGLGKSIAWVFLGIGLGVSAALGVF